MYANLWVAVLVLKNFIGIPPEQLLERLLELTLCTEENLRQDGRSIRINDQWRAQRSTAAHRPDMSRGGGRVGQNGTAPRASVRYDARSSGSTCKRSTILKWLSAQPEKRFPRLLSRWRRDVPEAPLVRSIGVFERGRLAEMQKYRQTAIMKATLTLTSRGVVTLPAKLRRALGLRADDQLIAETTPEGLLLRPAVTLLVEIYSEKRIGEFDEAEAELAKVLSHRSRPKKSAR